MPLLLACARALSQIFVGGLDGNVTEDQLREVFAPYGELVYVKIP